MFKKLKMFLTLMTLTVFTTCLSVQGKDSSEEILVKLVIANGLYYSQENAEAYIESLTEEEKDKMYISFSEKIKTLLEVGGKQPVYAEIILTDPTDLSDDRFYN